MPPGSESRTNGEFFFPSRSAREHEIDYVGARDQQNKSDGTQQHEQRCLYIANNFIEKRLGAHVPIGIRRRIGFRQALLNGLDLHFGLRKIGSGTQSSQHVIRMRNAVVKSPRAERAGGNPDAAALWEIESQRHHTDECVVFSIQQIGFADSARITAENGVRERVTDEKNLRAARNFILRREAVAKGRLHPEDGEEAAWRRASAGIMPAAMLAAICFSRWKRSSSPIFRSNSLFHGNQRRMFTTSGVKTPE